MNPVIKMILTLIVAAAVLVYTAYNYIAGKFGPFYLIMAVLLTIYLVYGLIRGMKNK